MKRFLLILLAVLSTVACKKVTPEDRIAQMAEYLASHQDIHAARLAQYDDAKRVDYLTLQLAKELEATDLWTLETADRNSLVAEFPGNTKGDHQLSLLTASLDDPAACAMLLNVLETFRDLKIRHKNDMRAIFYSTAKDSTGTDGLTALNQEMIDDGEIFAFDIALSSTASLPGYTFIISDKRAFVERMAEVVPPYIEPLGSFQLMQGVYPDPEWPLKGPVYRYTLNGDRNQDAAAIAAFTYLLNF